MTKERLTQLQQIFDSSKLKMIHETIQGLSEDEIEWLEFTYIPYRKIYIESSFAPYNPKKTNESLSHSFITATYEKRKNTLKKIKGYVENKKTKNTPKVLLKNQYSKIFKSDFGFTLFTRMHKQYEDEKKTLANYSYLYFAMEKEFLVCAQVDFVKFLENEKYDISIDKIDSRQWRLDMNEHPNQNYTMH